MNECICLQCQFKDFIANMGNVLLAQETCKILHSRNLREVYLNVGIALLERSFSTLKRVNFDLCSSMGQEDGFVRTYNLRKLFIIYFVRN